MNHQHGISIKYMDIDKCVFTPITNCTKTEQVFVHGSTTHQTLCNKTISDPTNNVMANSFKIRGAPSHIPDDCPGSGYILETEEDIHGTVCLKWSKKPELLQKPVLSQTAGADHIDFINRTNDLRIENDTIRTSIEHLKVQNEDLKNQNEELRARNRNIESQIEDLKTQITEVLHSIKLLQQTTTENATNIGYINYAPNESDTKLNLKTAKKILAENTPFINKDGQVVVPSDISSVLGAALTIIESKINK